MSDAGWNSDPTRRHELRYWDGERWTDHVSDHGVQSSDPVDAPPREAAPSDRVAERPRIPQAAVVAGGLFGAVLVLAALVAVGLAAANDTEPGTVALEQRAGSRTDVDGPTPTTTEPQRPTTTAPPTTTTTAPPATTTTAAPAVAAPAPTTAPPPPPPTTAPPTTAAPTTQPPSQSECHPSYEGTCIPPDVEDADCAGGSGDGPHYVQEKNIRVVGTDVFDLDRDGNGIGCES